MRPVPVAVIRARSAQKLRADYNTDRRHSRLVDEAALLRRGPPPSSPTHQTADSNRR